MTEVLFRVIVILNRITPDPEGLTALKFINGVQLAPLLIENSVKIEDRLESSMIPIVSFSQNDPSELS